MKKYIYMGNYDPADKNYSLHATELDEYCFSQGFPKWLFVRRKKLSNL